MILRKIPNTVKIKRLIVHMFPYPIHSLTCSYFLFYVGYYFANSPFYSGCMTSAFRRQPIWDKLSPISEVSVMHIEVYDMQFRFLM